MNKEFEFLNIISNNLSNSKYLGDDCAYLDEYKIAISKDCLIEDVHFSFDYMTPKEIAQKALLVNISDVLASGAKPKYALIGLSGNLNKTFIKEFYEKINEVANKYNIAIIGGDLTKASKLSISITILGDYKDRNISSRKNAKEDYIIAAYGEFGSSAQGLYNLQNNIKEDYFTNYHKNPPLYPKISDYLAKNTKHPYAMMDSSDGLIDCLIQIAQQSKVQINVNYNLIPKKIDNKEYVLYGGEDYALIVALHKEDFKKTNLIQIGTCKKGENVYLDNNLIEYKGYEHFE